MAGERAKGTVKMFNESKGFGFITGADDAKDYFVHFSAIKTDGFSTLYEGQQVEFTAASGDDDKPMALDVAVLSGEAHAVNDGKERVKGTVKWFDETKGFGFITGNDDAKDYFVHFSAIKTEGFKTLSEGQSVEFTPAVGDDGKLLALDVIVISG
ncbi:hypothetical protein PR202_gb26855 [Eleusine coracana subsp. coracana]|uniref:CSD domain-containing protein n=1 Tax=Eleusine coracana subsp. coracana TaxID=191504 RepID=A0AAV5FTI5_ELECO|nr:hypothetical protein PR202_gb26855 [Eleusine coracana subsp. coracana]